MNHTPTDVVIAAFKERGLSVKPDAIESALRDDPNHAEWVSTHLRPDTLLSREELTMQVSPAQQKETS
jgi:hypothetical protein